MKSKRGFTLIELLVVISIIALLIAILLPALRQAGESAEKAQCAVNCRQVVVAITAFATERDGKTPPSKYDLGEGVGGVYAIYRSSFPDVPDVGRWRRIGPLVDQGYLSDPWAMYCPSLIEDHPWLKPGGVDRYFCGYVEPAADGSLPPGLAIMVYSYHYRESYFDEKMDDYRTLNIDKDSGDEVVFADSFSAISRGVDYHHRDGYNFARLDGSTARRTTTSTRANRSATSPTAATTTATTRCLKSHGRHSGRAMNRINALGRLSVRKGFAH